MKKLLFLLSFILAFSIGNVINSYSQGTIVEPLTLPVDTIKGITDDITVYSPLLDEYWDYSIQFKASFYGSGDSSYFNLKTYQTNDPAQSVWTEITAERDTLNTKTDVQGLISTMTDFGGIWAKHVLTGMAADSVIIVPYVVKKQKRNRFY